MIKIDLITGFLGSGKTTFLQSYADYLLRQGQKIGILEYDHGAINIDFMLLQNLRGENCELEMLAAACDADCHKRRFKTKLISMAMSGYDRILIEPSGVFDVDKFLDSINDSPLDKWCEAGSIITVVDAGISQNEISSAGESLLVSQIANAGAVVLSKTQLYDSCTIDRTKQFLNSALKKSACFKNITDILEDRPWSDFSDEDYEAFSQCGYRLSDYVKYGFGAEEQFETVCFMNENIGLETVKRAAEQLLGSNEYGEIIRIKGFAVKNNQWYLINAERNGINIEKSAVGKDTLIVIGEQLQEDKIRSLLTEKNTDED